MDLIDRQAAIDALADYIHNIDKVYSTGKLSADDCKDAAKSVLDDLPSARPDITDINVGDTIYRQAALNAMDTWDKFGCGPDGKLVRYDDDKHYIPYVHYEDMVHAIKHLPSAQQWIPCSEKLPEKSGLYLVTTPFDRLMPVHSRYFNKRGEQSEQSFWSGHPMNEVVAWMPLPEPYPYKGEQE
jgi:hypothetical protein